MLTASLFCYSDITFYEILLEAFLRFGLELDLLGLVLCRRLGLGHHHFQHSVVELGLDLGRVFACREPANHKMHITCKVSNDLGVTFALNKDIQASSCSALLVASDWGVRTLSNVRFWFRPHHLIRGMKVNGAEMSRLLHPSGKSQSRVIGGAETLTDLRSLRQSCSLFAWKPSGKLCRRVK